MVLVHRELELLVGHVDVAIREKGTGRRILLHDFLLGAAGHDGRIAEQVIPAVVTTPANVFFFADGHVDLGLLRLHIFVAELLVLELIVGASCLSMIGLVRFDIGDDLELLLGLLS